MEGEMEIEGREAGWRSNEAACHPQVRYRASNLAVVTAADSAAVEPTLTGRLEQLPAPQPVIQSINHAFPPRAVRTTLGILSRPTLPVIGYRYRRHLVLAFAARGRKGLKHYSAHQAPSTTLTLVFGRACGTSSRKRALASSSIHKAPGRTTACWP